DDAADLGLQRLVRLRRIVCEPLLGYSGLRMLDVHRDRPARRAFLAVDPELLLGQAEQSNLRSDRLGLAEHKEPLSVERVVEDRDQPLLEDDVHVDEDVAAQNQIEAREGWILREVLAREDAEIAHGL